MRTRIPVAVGPGIFSNERLATFQANDKRYTMILDERLIQDNSIEVNVISQNDGEAIVDLPTETFTTGNRIRVPIGTLVTE